MNTISLREAARYNIPQATLSGWVHARLIRVFKRPERRGQPLLVFEADIIDAKRAYTPGRGHHNQKAIAKALIA